jgi:hypothetical protein
MSADWPAVLAAVALDHGHQLADTLEHGITAAQHSAAQIADCAATDPARFHAAVADAFTAVFALDSLHVSLATHPPAELERVIDALMQLATAAATSALTELGHALEPSRIY